MQEVESNHNEQDKQKQAHESAAMDIDKDMEREEGKEQEVQENETQQGESAASMEAAPEEELSEVDKLKEEVGQAKDKYIRLYSEFENFRRRTAKEKMELTKTANEDMMLAVLPVLDDFERAKKALENKQEETPGKEGFELIHHKFFKILEQKGLKPMEDLVGKEFNSEIQEAITSIPAPEESLKGKVVDVVEKGYFLNEKVIRFAKVIIGA